MIALGDVLTQTLSMPIEKELFRRLRITETDGTFDQDKQRKRVREASNLKVRCFSIDMKSCTDRLPVLFQVLCLHYSGLLTKEQSLAWYLLMVKRVFSFGKARNMAVTYSVGQPMGFHSSWAVMAFSHHCLVKWAASSVGLESFQDYALLGDDIVIWNAKVATKYLQLLSKLGVEISSTKSFSEVGLAEFAKSYYRQGEDLKPLPAALLI